MTSDLRVPLRRVRRTWRLERELAPFDGDTRRLLSVLFGARVPPVQQRLVNCPSQSLENANFWLSTPSGQLQEVLCGIPGPPPSLTVLFLVHPGEFNAIGGGQVQLLCTVRELAAMGVRCLITDRLDLPLDYDILHVWALDQYEHSDSICRVTKPKVVSTIYWNYAQLYALRAVLRQIHRRGMLVALERRGAIAPYWALRFRDTQYPYHLLHLWRARLANRRLVRSCDVALPNCERERQWLQTDFGLPADRAVVVPNGADAAETGASPDLFRRMYPHIGAFVLCVGRVEENKNQLMTICALKGLDTALVFAGACDATSAYYQMCQQAAGGSRNVHFLGPLARPVLFSAYAAASAHVLPSWSETPGLANIEAALCGCPIVCGNIGAEQEYFGDAAFYCNPGDAVAIASAVRACLAQGRHSERLDVLRARLLETFTWRRAAMATRAVYDTLACTGGGSCAGPRVPRAKGSP